MYDLYTYKQNNKKYIYYKSIHRYKYKNQKY